MPISRQTIELQGLRIAYCASGDEPAPAARPGEPGPREAVVLLHGWGGSIESMWPIYEYLTPQYAVYALDFPGFGASSPPPAPWGVGDYLALVMEWLERLHISRATFLGHSFGGRVSIMLAAK